MGIKSILVTKTKEFVHLMASLILRTCFKIHPVMSRCLPKRFEKNQEGRILTQRMIADLIGAIESDLTIPKKMIISFRLPGGGIERERCVKMPTSGFISISIVQTIE